MDKELLIRFFEGRATEEELDAILSWIDESDENKEKLAKEKDVWVMSTNDKSDAPEVVYDIIKDKAESANKQSRRYRALKIAFSAAAALVVALTATIVIMNHSFSSKTNEYEQLLVASEQTNLPLEERDESVVLSAAKGVKASFALPDGTKVILNSDSQLTYPKEFTGATRDVHLVGEARFEVVRNEHIPMIITTDKQFEVRVLGTSLSVKSYPNDSYSTTTLYSGKVKMLYRDTEIDLKPDQSCMITDNSNVVKIITETKPESKSAWTKGKLVFEDTPMTEVLKMIERWHGTHFVIKNETPLKYSITAVFEEESVIQIMEALKFLISLNYTVDKNIITII